VETLAEARTATPARLGGLIQAAGTRRRWSRPSWPCRRPGGLCRRRPRAVRPWAAGA